MSNKIDVLNRDNFIEKLIMLVNTLSSNRQGCCFAVNGVWGSGKTFVLEKFEKQLARLKWEDNKDNIYYVFHYDCWKYDYYDEPAIAIISAMLDATDKELALFPEGVENAMTVSLKTVRKILSTVAGELCKNKIGIDLVEIASDVLEEQQEENEVEFDLLYGFKRALECTRKNIQEIAKDKTVVIVVDELDRCLPQYAIKVLERLHHIFEEIENVIVIISMDKKQLEHSIKEIYGNIEVDAYLRKFIAFKVDLGNGIASNFANKYQSYFSMFEMTQPEIWEIEDFFVNVLSGLDIRTQERIFRKAEIVHKIINKDDIKDCSIMAFEILFLIIALKLEDKNLKWLSEIWKVHHVSKEEKLGKSYYDMLKHFGEKVINGMQANGKYCIVDGVVGKAFFWLANLYNKYENRICGPYIFYEPADKRVEMVHRFAEVINMIDVD